MAYVLFLDESGTHGGSPVFVLAGIAVHENDAWLLERKLESTLHNKLNPLGLKAYDFELHAAEIKTPVRPATKKKKKRKVSPWEQVSLSDRLDVLRATYSAIELFRPTTAERPFMCFGAAVDGRRADRERLAYELVLNKFDRMLSDLYRADGQRERGLVVHDKRVIERSVQEWTAQWKEAADKVGQLRNIVAVPTFADSKATRLLQAADFICWAMWRYYGLVPGDSTRIERLWSLFHQDDGYMHGAIHVSPAFAKGTCRCLPCTSRFERGLDPTA